MRISGSWGARGRLAMSCVIERNETDICQVVIFRSRIQAVGVTRPEAVHV
jgi:hypothetical protein